MKTHTRAHTHTHTNIRFGVVGLPYGVLAGGVLTGKYSAKKWAAKAEKDKPLEKNRMIDQPDFQVGLGSPAYDKLVG